MTTYSPSTFRNYGSALRSFERYTGIPLTNVLQGKVSEPELLTAIDRWVEALHQAGNKVSTIRARVSAFRSVIKVDAPLPANAQDELIRPSLTADDLRRLFEHLPHTEQGTQDRALFAALTFVQAPLADVLSASWADASLRNWPAPVLDAVAALNTHLGKRAPRLDAPIFSPLTDRYTRLTGQPASYAHLSQQEVSRRLRKYGDRLGLILTARELRAVGHDLLEEMSAEKAAERIGLVTKAAVRRTLNNYRYTKTLHR